MKKLRIVAELEYDDDSMHGDYEEGLKWFHQDVLLTKSPGEGLVLYSHHIGDEVGEIVVLEVEEV